MIIMTKASWGDYFSLRNIFIVSILNMESLIKKLCNSSFVSGFEQQGSRTVLLDYLEKCHIPFEQDVVGNVILTKKGAGESSLMLVAHYDEVGFTVRYVDDNGFIYFSAIGGIDTSILRGQKVVISHNGIAVEGVIGAKPIHMINQTKNVNSNKTIDISDLWIDIGVTDREKIKSLVSIGDSISFSQNYSKLQGDTFTSKSIDNRAGVVALLELYSRLQEVKTRYRTIYFLFSAQEELGLRGARVVGYNINPDICIAIDVTHATDYPTVNKNKYGDIRLNHGAVIPIGPNFDYAIQNSLRSTAKDHGILFQVESIPGHSGTDISEIQLVRGGRVSGQISVPCRYMHTPVELATISDIEAVEAILEEFCRGWAGETI